MTEYVPKLTETGRPIPEPGLRAQLMRIRYDLTAAQGKLTEAFAMFDALHIDDQPAERTSFMNGPVTADQCPSCGVGAIIENDKRIVVHAADCPTLKPAQGPT